jgi:uncharacterized protein (DUF58 family)
LKRTLQRSPRKVFEEKRELTMMLMVDISGSESFGSKANLKDIVTEIATMAFSATQNNDKIGLILFSDQMNYTFRQRRSHVLRIIRELIEFEPKSLKTDIAQVKNFIQYSEKKAIVFVISDFMAEDYEHTLKIAAKNMISQERRSRTKKKNARYRYGVDARC